MMAVPIETEPTFNSGNPAVLFDVPDLLSVNGAPRMFDIHPDGQQFLMIKGSSVTSENPLGPQINVVLNWFEELKRLVPSP